MPNKPLQPLGKDEPSCCGVWTLYHLRGDCWKKKKTNIWNTIRYKGEYLFAAGKHTHTSHWSLSFEIRQQFGHWPHTLQCPARASTREPAIMRGILVLTVHQPSQITPVVALLPTWYPWFHRTGELTCSLPNSWERRGSRHFDISLKEHGIFFLQIFFPIKKLPC